MKKNLLQKIMKDAWLFFRTTGKAFSECLKLAWANFKLVKALHQGIVKFFFQKVDGSLREAWGTLNEDRIPAIAGTDNRKRNETVQVYFDTEKNEWRCFKKLNLVKIA